MKPARTSPRPPAAGRRLSTDVRRAQIADAALELADEVGVEGLSMAGIARALGLVPSALYRHFRSKDEIVDAMLERVTELLAEVVSEAQAGTGLQALERLLSGHLGLLGRHPAISEVVFGHGVHGERPDRQARVAGRVQAYLRRVADWMRAGQTRGEIRPDADPDDLALLFFSLIRGPATLQAVDRGFDPKAAGQRAWRLVAPALSPRSLNLQEPEK